MKEAKVPYRIGLDIGKASVGWAVVDVEQNFKNQMVPVAIRDVGVRLFREYKGEKIRERRVYRSSRRSWQRKRLRLNDLLALFEQKGLMSQMEFRELFRIGEQYETKEQRRLPFTPVDVYRLRAEGLDRLLNQEEWVRVLYRLAKHRGFKSNAAKNFHEIRKNELAKYYEDKQKSKKENEDEDAKALAVMEKNRSLLSGEKKSYRTVGEMLYQQNKEKHGSKRKYRNSKILEENHFYFWRADIGEEIKYLFESQRSFDNPFADQSFEQAYVAIWGRQRSFDLGPGSRNDKIFSIIREKTGFCTFEKNQRRAPKDALSYALFTVIQQLQNVQISKRHGNGKYQKMKLANQEITKILSVYQLEGKQISYADLRLLLGIASTDYFSVIDYNDTESTDSKSNSKKKKSAKVWVDQNDFYLSEHAIEVETENKIIFESPWIKIKEAIKEEYLYWFEKNCQEERIQQGLASYSEKEMKKIKKQEEQFFDSSFPLAWLKQNDALSTYGPHGELTYLEKIRKGNVIDGLIEFFSYFKTHEMRFSKGQSILSILKDKIAYEKINRPFIERVNQVFQDEYHSVEISNEKEAFTRFIWTALVHQLEVGGFGNLSFTSLYKLIPVMSGQYDGQCYPYFEACEKVGYDFRDGNYGAYGAEYYLPPLDEKRYFGSPVALHAMKQAIQIVNAIIKRYGSPEAIHIEVARDITKSEKMREQIEKQQKENEKEKKKLVDEIKSLNIKLPKKFDTLRYRLYKEQKETCPYSGEKIDLDKLFTANYEIDHIVPYSISYDNSIHNKVLVVTDENRKKSNLTAHDYMATKGDGALVRYHTFVRTLSCSGKKRRNLLEKVTKEKYSKDFRDRDLQDTRQATVFLADHIRKNLRFDLRYRQNQDIDHVSLVAGGITARYRNWLGVSKDRGDVRHHAKDAVVIAITSTDSVYDALQFEKWVRARIAGNLHYEWKEKNGIITLVDHDTKEIFQFSSHSITEEVFAHERYGSLMAKFVEPWHDFSTEVRIRLETSVFETLLKENHVENDLEKSSDNNKYLGYELEEQYYQAWKGKKLYPILPSRKVRAITTGQIHGDTIYPVDDMSTNGKKARLLIRNGKATNGDINRIDIYLVENGKKRSYLTVAQYIGQPESSLKHPGDVKYHFLFSLRQNDLVAIREKEQSPRRFFVVNSRSSDISFFLHDVYQSGVRDECLNKGIANLYRLEKWRIDILGRKHLVHNGIFV